MTPTQCTDKHTYTITGQGGETIARTSGGPKTAWVHWTTAGDAALDMTATHPDGAMCLTATHAARALLPCGPYHTRKDARIDGRPLLDAMDAADPDDGPMTDDVRKARRQAADEYVIGRLTHLGVELGTFDRRIAEWVSEWEPEVVATILGWAVRARHAGRGSAMGEQGEC